VAPQARYFDPDTAEWRLRHQGGSLLTGGRPIAQLSKERLSELSPGCERCLDAWATAAQRDPHASSLNNVVEMPFHKINSVRLKTIKEDMHADRVSAAPR
jgi:hypothetical protein